MSILERIEADFKAALKARQKDRISALRLVRSALKLKEKEDRGSLDEEAVIKVLKTQAKQRQDAAQQFEQGGRAELAAKERAELELIRAYLPAQVDEETVRQVVAEVVGQLGASSPKDMGPVMKASLEKLGAGADGKTVNRIALEFLKAG
ncbi:MAG: GatB/YqeY domain-containing protein [Deltaproteobacteria bacterium]|nr:GatB/YqeY domain-containing protein [Deltaproteobacteria bacterium]